MTSHNNCSFVVDPCLFAVNDAYETLMERARANALNLAETLPEHVTAQDFAQFAQDIADSIHARCLDDAGRDTLRLSAMLDDNCIYASANKAKRLLHLLLVCAALQYDACEKDFTLGMENIKSNWLLDLKKTENNGKTGPADE